MHIRCSIGIGPGAHGRMSHPQTRQKFRTFNVSCSSLICFFKYQTKVHANRLFDLFCADRYETLLAGCKSVKGKELGKHWSLYRPCYCGMTGRDTLYTMSLWRYFIHMCLTDEIHLCRCVLCRRRKTDIIEPEDSKRELLVLGMRTRRGINLERFYQLTGQDLLQVRVHPFSQARKMKRETSTVFFYGWRALTLLWACVTNWNSIWTRTQRRRVLMRGCCSWAQHRCRQPSVGWLLRTSSLSAFFHRLCLVVNNDWVIASRAWRAMSFWALEVVCFPGSP